MACLTLLPTMAQPDAL